MRCEKVERWISDDLDASLAPGNRRKLGSHLKSCVACREYRRQVRRIQAESQSPEGPEVRAERLEALSGIVVQRLRLERTTGRAGFGFRLTWRWAGVAASSVLALALGIVLLRGRGEVPPDDMFSLETCLDRVAWELAGDAETAARFDRLIADSLVGEGDPFLPSDEIYIWNEPYFWEGLSEDELKLVEEEVKKEIPS